MAYAVQTTPAWQAPSLPPFLQDFLTFRGRMNRASYWGAGLILVIVAIVMGLIAGATLTMIQNGVAAVALVIITSVAMLALAVPGYFIAIKRLHDRNKSGHWHWLFCLAPRRREFIARVGAAVWPLSGRAQEVGAGKVELSNGEQGWTEHVEPLRRHERHARPRHRLADRRGITRIRLVALDIRLDVLRTGLMRRGDLSGSRQERASRV